MFSIDLSPETYRRLLQHIESFEDTPEHVVRRLLDAVEDGGATSSHELKSNNELLKEEGALLPESEYWIPILEILAAKGGAMRGRDVIDALEARLGRQLTARDHDVLEMGEVRWRNRARFARLRMKEQGLISDESPRGIWEITEEGRRFLNERAPR